MSIAAGSTGWIARIAELDEGIEQLGYVAVAMEKPGDGDLPGEPRESAGLDEVAERPSAEKGKAPGRTRCRS